MKFLNLVIYVLLWVMVVGAFMLATTEKLRRELSSLFGVLFYPLLPVVLVVAGVCAVFYGVLVLYFGIGHYSKRAIAYFSKN